MLSPALDRRAQYLVAGSTVISAAESSDFEENVDEAQGSGIEGEEYDSANETAPIPRVRLDSFLGLDWDEDDENNVNSPSLSCRVTIPRGFSGRYSAGCAYPSSLTHDNSAAPGEDSPLLHKKISFSASTPAHLGQAHDVKGDPASRQVESFAQQSYLTIHSPLPQRRLSTTSSSEAVIYNFGGKSTFGQTVSSLSRSESIAHRLILARPALQFNSNSSWHRDAIGTTGLRLLWLGRRDLVNNHLWVPCLLYVRSLDCTVQF